VIRLTFGTAVFLLTVWVVSGQTSDIVPSPQGEANGLDNPLTEAEASTAEATEAGAPDPDKPDLENSTTVPPSPGASPPAGLEFLGNGVFPRTRYPVQRKGLPVYAAGDFTGNGNKDVCVIVLDDSDLTDLEILSDLSRLFRGDVTLPEFALLLFVREDDRYLPGETVILGRYPVLDGFGLEVISDDGPMAAAVTFQRTEGPLSLRVTFLDGARSVFSMPENPTLRWISTDIDGDGILDHVSYQAGFEEGKGYETFITWYRWTPDGYTRHRSTNIVRNLNVFLERSRRMISDGRFNRFLEYAVHPDVYDEALREGISADELVHRVFVPDPMPDTTPTPMPTDLSGLDVVMPHLRENPFPQIGRETSFEVSIRLEFPDEDRDPLFFRSRIGTAANPFAARQFYFVPVSSSGP
jgi:hypothetical protein